MMEREVVNVGSNCKLPPSCDSLPEQELGSAESDQRAEEVPALRELKPIQHLIIRRFVAMLDTQRDSVVITNPLARNSPIVHVTQAWQAMCGYRSEEAVGQNPSLTQGEGSDPSTIQGIRIAIQQQRSCKVRLLNYRGQEREPFWNCLTVRRCPVSRSGSRIWEPPLEALFQPSLHRTMH